MTPPRYARGNISLVRWRGIKIWRYEVTDCRGQVVAWDDCADYDKVQQMCRATVFAVSRVCQLGQTLRPYADIIEEIRHV